VRRARGALGSASRPRRADGFPRLPASVGCGGRSEARVLHRGCAACAPLPRSRRRWRRSRACASPRVCRFRSRRSRPARSRPRRGAVSAPRAGRSSRRLAARAPRRVLRPPWSRRVVVPVLGVAPRSRSAPSSPAPRAPRRSRRVARARSRVRPRVSPRVPVCPCGACVRVARGRRARGSRVARVALFAAVPWPARARTPRRSRRRVRVCLFARTVRASASRGRRPLRFPPRASPWTPARSRARVASRFSRARARRLRPGRPSSRRSRRSHRETSGQRCPAPCARQTNGHVRS